MKVLEDQILSMQDGTAKQHFYVGVKDNVFLALKVYYKSNKWYIQQLTAPVEIMNLCKNFEIAKSKGILDENDTLKILQICSKSFSQLGHLQIVNDKSELSPMLYKLSKRK